MAQHWPPLRGVARRLSLACGCLCFVPAFLGCVFLALPVILKSKLSAKHPVKHVPFEGFLANADVERVLPLAPATFPEAFRGILWMDQTGSYGHSDLPLGAPDLALSFGASDYDPSTRTLAVDVAGPAWTWMNRWEGYLVWWWLRKAGFFYIFELSEDSTVIQVYPSLDLGFAGRWSLPKELLSFTMVKPPPADVACPPEPGTSKEVVVKCATWDRVSTGFFSPLLGSYGVIHYYVYQIVDGEGNRVQPYYDAYLKFADSSCKPNEELAKLLALAHPRGNECPSAFRGVRAAASTSTVLPLEAPALSSRTPPPKSGEL